MNYLSCTVRALFFVPLVMLGMQNSTKVIPYENGKKQKAITLTDQQLNTVRKASVLIKTFLDDGLQATKSQPKKIHLPNISADQFNNLMPLFECTQKIDITKKLNIQSTEELIGTINGLNYLNAESILPLAINTLGKKVGHNSDSFITDKQHRTLISNLPYEISQPTARAVWQNSGNVTLYSHLIENSTHISLLSTHVQSYKVDKFQNIAISSSGKEFVCVGPWSGGSNQSTCIIYSRTPTIPGKYRITNAANCVVFLPNSDLAIIGTSQELTTLSLNQQAQFTSITLGQTKDICVHEKYPDTVFSLHGDTTLAASSININTSNIVTQAMSLPIKATNLALSPNGDTIAVLFAHSVGIASTKDIKNGNCTFKEATNVSSFSKPVLLRFTDNTTIEKIGSEEKLTERIALNGKKTDIIKNEEAITAYAYSTDGTLRTYGTAAGDVILEKKVNNTYVRCMRWPAFQSEGFLDFCTGLFRPTIPAIQRIVIAPDNQTIIAIDGNGFSRAFNLKKVHTILNYLEKHTTLEQLLFLCAALKSSQKKPLNISDDQELKNIHNTLLDISDDKHIASTLKKAIQESSCVIRSKDEFERNQAENEMYTFEFSIIELLKKFINN